MTDLRKAAKEALRAFQCHVEQTWPTDRSTAAIAALRAALAQQAEPQTLDEALTLPRAMAQAYESGHKSGAAAEREACAKLCEARFVGDLTREDMEARRCAAAIRARGNT